MEGREISNAIMKKILL